MTEIKAQHTAIRYLELRQQETGSRPVLLSNEPLYSTSCQQHFLEVPPTQPSLSPSVGHAPAMAGHAPAMDGQVPGSSGEMDTEFV